MNTLHELLPHDMYSKNEILYYHQSQIIDKTFDQLIKENLFKLMLQVMKCCNN